MAVPEVPKKSGRALNDRQLAFAIWLATPAGARVPKEQADLAVTLGISRQMLWRWSKDPRVLEAARVVTLQNAGDPAKITQVLDMVADMAINKKDLKAADLWLRSVGAMASMRTSDAALWDQVTNEALDALSDEQLEAALAAKQAEADEAAAMLAAKKALSVVKDA